MDDSEAIMWIAMTVNKKLEVSCLGKVFAIPLSDTAKGCKGCLLVFDTKKNAMEYTGNDNVVEIIPKGLGVVENPVDEPGKIDRRIK